LDAERFESAAVGRHRQGVLALGVPLTGWDALTLEDDWRRQPAPAF
jgi:hypothetical protein